MKKTTGAARPLQSITIRLSQTDLANAQALAKADDQSIARLIRHLLRDAHIARFGVSTRGSRAATKARAMERIERLLAAVNAHPEAFGMQKAVKR